MEIERGRGGKGSSCAATGVAWEKGGNTVVVHLHREGGWLVLRAETESVFLALLYPYFSSLFFLLKKSISLRRNFRYIFQKGVTPPAWDMWKGGGGPTHKRG